MTVFWDVATCSLVEIDRRFGRAYYLHYQGDRCAYCLHRHGVDGGKSCSETLVNLHEITPSKTPQDICLHTHCHKNLKSQDSMLFIYLESKHAI
jgi:hypothetical protein